jgi:hypothetical protein
MKRPKHLTNKPTMKTTLLIASAALTLMPPALRAEAADLRPPAVPLVAHDPYFSVWSQADKLTDVETTHWTGKRHRLESGVTIDGKPFRLMGAEPAATPALPQTGVEVLPTPLADARLRRPVFDPVHAQQPAPVLAPQRLGGRRPAAAPPPRNTQDLLALRRLRRRADAPT